ncbi:transposase [Streptomyces massasporeus]
MLSFPFAVGGAADRFVALEFGSEGSAHDGRRARQRRQARVVAQSDRAAHLPGQHCAVNEEQGHREVHDIEADETAQDAQEQGQDGGGVVQRRLLWIVDGTLVPVRDRTVGASSRNYRFSANVQVIIDADTRLVVAPARPAPVNRADAHVWRESDLPALTAGTTVTADGAYLGTGLIVPHRRRAGRPLLRGQEEDNAEHRRVRARVEHTFARMKNWKILRDCRQRGDGLHHAVQAVATMHNLALAG